MPKPEFEQTVWIDPTDARRPDVLAQALMILSDNIKAAPKELVYTLTAALEPNENMGREMFMLSVKGSPP